MKVNSKLHAPAILTLW